MTLPRGFGSGGHEGHCTECGEYYYTKKGCETPNCKAGKENEIPISRKQLNLHIWHGIFALLMGLSIYVGLQEWWVGMAMGIMVFLFGQLIAMACFEPVEKLNSRRSRYTRDYREYTHAEVFPWFIPLWGMSNKYHFKPT